VELGVGKGLEGLAALLLGDVTSTLQVVEGEDVLELLVGVNDGAVSVFLAVAHLLNKELLDTLGLLVGEEGGQVLNSGLREGRGVTYLEELENLVFAEVVVRVLEHFVVHVL
jgi:hypothetical protein